MAPLAPHHDEAQRLAEVRALDLVALRPVIDRVTRLAGSAANSPFAYVVLVDEDRVWMSGFEGVPEEFAALSTSTTAQTLHEGAVWREDLAAKWPGHPWVKGPPYARFYCNAPVQLSNGARLGALCVVGPEPRERDERLMADLADLAALLAEAVERLRAGRKAEEAANEARAATVLKDAIMRASPVALGMTDRDLRYLYVNERWVEEKGIPEGEALGRTMEELFPASYPTLEESYRACLAGETLSTDRILVPSHLKPDRWLRASLCP